MIDPSKRGGNPESLHGTLDIYETENKNGPKAYYTEVGDALKEVAKLNSPMRGELFTYSRPQ